LIRKAEIQDAADISSLGRITFLEAHRHSSPEEDLNAYLDSRFHIDEVTRELSDPKNHFFLYFHNEQLAGYSKIVFDMPAVQIPEATNLCKLERLYISKDFYGKKIGLKLFQFNKELCLQHQQAGIWLTVWVENERAIAFYERAGFRIVGEILFKVGTTENPNYVMWLEF
jgi:ribosomal protein S18 acetylase RimI-like enzyme